MLNNELNNETAAKPCNKNTPSNSKKKFRGFNDEYFLKLDFDEKTDSIIIICYNTSELENKRYEIKLVKNDFDILNKIFRIFDKLDEIYEYTYQIFKLNKYKIYELKDKDELKIELNYLINHHNNNISINIELFIKPNMNGDFTNDFNYILKNEIINMKKKYNKEISDLKKENKELMNELNMIKK